MPSEIHAVIMAGGAGTRFWPKSRSRTPKQLLALHGPHTLLEDTVARLDGLCLPSHTWVVTGAEQHAATRELLPALPPERVLAEPARRDTAACVGLAAALVERTAPGATMIVLPADHLIAPAERFRDALRRACEAAGEEGIATIGIRPDHPATGYGYIERGEPLGPGVYRVARFVEKPARERAEQYLAGGRHDWNAGIFAFRAAHMLREIGRHLPAHAARLDTIARAFGTRAFDEVLAAEFPQIPRISIDYGVMEKTERIVVVEADFEWDDVGSWAALARHLPERGGHASQARLSAVDSSGCIAWSDDPGHLIGLVGVSDLIVVHTADATLVCHRSQAEQVKALVERCRREGLDAWID